jgi:hypothetical protein
VKLYRPYVPLEARITVATRQLVERGWQPGPAHLVSVFTLRSRLNYLLFELFGEAPAHLDHDPPLMLRKFNRKTLRYEPDANDPNFLVYRAKEEHFFKTYVRGSGAQYSDAALRRREIRRKKKTMYKYRWPKRKLRSRSMFAVK